MSSLRLYLPPALHHRNFTLLWAGLLISVAGSQMQFAALLWHLRELSDQPAVVSGIGLARFLPVLLFAPFGGVIADSLNRRKVMLVTQTTALLVAVVLGLVTWLGIAKLWHLYLLTAIQMTAVSFDLPARQALTPNLVSRDALPSAFSLMSIAFSTGAIIGPAVGGMVIAGAGLAYTYWINAITYLAVIVALLAMGEVPQQRQPAVHGARQALASIRDGARFILNQPIILSSMVLDFLATFFSSANTLLPFVARDVLNVGGRAYGWLVSGQSLGAVVVGVFLSQRTHVRRQGLVLLVSVAIFGVATIGFGLARSFWWVLAALVVIGASDGVSTILRNTIRQLNTPDEMRGRMVAINQVFFMGGPQLGEIEAGLVAQAFGTSTAIITGGIGCILGVGLVAALWAPLRRYGGGEETGAGIPG
ncbi:MAG: MFS transporter [Anaerolineae bacterium]|nr:MFS transporter [Anaerolineae bacterium]